MAPHEADDLLAYGSESEAPFTLHKGISSRVQSFFQRQGSDSAEHDGLDYSEESSRGVHDSEEEATNSRNLQSEHLTGYLRTSAAAPQQTGRSEPSFMDKLKDGAQHFGHNVRHYFERLDVSDDEPGQRSTKGVTERERYDSFAPIRRSCNAAKWYVDGCGYFWAVSEALQTAQESIFILDWWLSPELYLRRPPKENEHYRLDRMLKAAAARGVKINVIVYKEVPQALSLDSAHTKHALEALHPNIRVFRHPDHIPASQTFESSFISAVKGTKLTAAAAGAVGEDSLKALFGVSNDVILYWAHHEKLCIVDRRLAFMGGLDLCYGRWDLHQHPLADVHPADIDQTVFPGQDYNNARIMDFQDVGNYEGNKLDRTENARMGWSDVSVCVSGPVIQDLLTHFTARWNFIYAEKYADVKEYSSLPRDLRAEDADTVTPQAQETCQIVRSCTKWSNGTALEHSITNAYVDLIEKAEHFVYIENQFFITATGDSQKPIQNHVGAAIVDRVLRAARSGQKFRVIVCIPAVPGFAGDLRGKDSTSTRAIMQYQYWSINRGGHSIYERIAEQGFDPSEYIRFYNLRNYDRINSDASLRAAEQHSGVRYEEARKALDDQLCSPSTDAGTDLSTDPTVNLQKFEQATGAGGARDRSSNDTVSDAYMLNGRRLEEISWEEGGPLAELDAFVSEELYIHSKILIADDRRLIVGSANLNDRSQLGSHDSEIAVVVEDGEQIQAAIGGEQTEVSSTISSLRRHLFRKHLGLIEAQDMRRPDDNYKPLPAPNAYDWGSDEDKLVADPLSEAFWDLWNSRAKTNTQAFDKVFHPVPHDGVRTWKQYEQYYERFFHGGGSHDDGGDDKGKHSKQSPPSSWKWGHVVGENFGSVREVKEELGKIRGSLVEMPLDFLADEEIAKEGIALNAFTKVVYT